MFAASPEVTMKTLLSAGETVNTSLCFPSGGSLAKYLLDKNVKLFEIIRLKVLQFGID